MHASSAAIEAARRELRRAHSGQPKSGNSQVGVSSDEDGNGSDNGTGTADPLASPGCCASDAVWRRACPAEGYHVLFGAEEVLAREVRRLIARIEGAGRGPQPQPPGEVQGLDGNGGSGGEVLEGDGDKVSREEKMVRVTERAAGIHAWPVVDMFLGEGKGRLEGLRGMAGWVGERFLE